MAEEEDFTNVALRQRLSHKSWKGRQHAYQELNSVFEKCTNVNVPKELSIYWESPELFVNFIGDSNVVAQESAIGALCTLLEFMTGMSDGVPDTSAIRTLWIPQLVEKGLSSSRLGVKTKSLECILIITSLDISIRTCMELMLPFTSNKLPRLLSSLINAMAKIVMSFGFVNVKKDFWAIMLEPLPRLAGHANSSVRSETLNFILEIYKWTGKAFLQDMLLNDLKPIQQKDLDKVFSEYDGIIPPSEQPRLFHWQLAQKNSVETLDKDGDTLMREGFSNAPAICENGATKNGASTVVADPFDLLPTSSIMKSLPPEFDQQIKSPKWKDRVEALQKVYDEILKPVKKLDPLDDYSSYVRVLTHILAKDANLQAATTAANSVTHLVKCLREGINPYAHHILDSLLQRTKEKKPSVSEAVNEALESIEKYYGVDNCLETIVEYINHKIPQVRLQATNLLIGMLQKQWKPTASRLKDEIVVKMLPNIISAVFKVANDTQSSLRDSGFECFATMMKLFGDREFSEQLDKFDSQKKKKIYEYYEKITTNASVVTLASQNTSDSTGPIPMQHSKTTRLTNSSTSTKNFVPNISPFTERRSLTQHESFPNLKHSSTIPSKRGPTSPLKEIPRAKGSGSSKSRLFSRSPNHLTHSTRPSHFSSPTSHSQVIPSVVMTELEELRTHKLRWNKERQDLVAKLTSFQTQTSQLNSENQMLQDQISDIQIALNEKTMTVRSKDLQITKLKNRLSILEGELDNALSTKNIPDTPVKTVLDSIHAISPSRHNSANEGSVYSAGELSDPCLSNQPHNLQQFTKTFSGSVSSNVGLTDRFSPLNSSILVATSSELSDELPRRVNSLHIMDTSNAVAGSLTTNGSSASVLSDESWKRAAEVTNQLKARIERMRAKTRGLNIDIENT